MTKEKLCRATLGVPPNGLAFSCRERAKTSLQNSTDLAREAVSCNAVLGRSLELLLYCVFRQPDALKAVYQ